LAASGAITVTAPSGDNGAVTVALTFGSSLKRDLRSRSISDARSTIAVLRSIE
jgi:hypothetical protein